VLRHGGPMRERVWSCESSLEKETQESSSVTMSTVDCRVRDARRSVRGGSQSTALPSFHTHLGFHATSAAAV
jgi:hypothetical protein